MQTLKKFYFGKSKYKPFVSTWKTDNLSSGSSTATQVKLPLVSTGSYNFVVEWGDGTQSTITAWNQAQVTKTYSVAGTYQITIKGKCIGWIFNNTGDRLKILSIQQWGSLSLGTNQGSYFYGCANLNLSSVSDLLNLNGLSNIVYCFRACSSITTINRINEWNLGTLNISGLFYSCTSFNQDLGLLNVSNVTSFSEIFFGCSLFNNGGSSSISSWNTSKVTNMSSMFQGTLAFNQPIGNWNTSNVTNMVNMFLYAKAFNQPIGNWNTSNVTNMAGMFQYAQAFNQPIGNWNTSNVTNMAGMFQGTLAFNQDLNWNTSNVTNMASMFLYAQAFNQPIGNWNTSNVTNMADMFQGTLAFNQDLNWNTSNVTNMASMFLYAQAFNQPIGNWNTSNVTNMVNMFQYAQAFNQPIGNWNTSNVTNMASMFLYAQAFNQNIGSWNVSNVTNFVNFMSSKTTATFSTTNLDAIYNGWSSRPVKTPISISFGKAKYTAASSAGRAVLTGAPNNWVITDGGI